MLDTLFGEGQSGLKILFSVIVVLALLALAFWLLRRFGGGRLGGGATRGRQPRLAVIDQATVDGRRRLVLIRRDNVEHLLIIGGPTDVVVEQNIVRAATALREAAPTRPPAAADTLPRAVPLGEDTMWPLQPEPAPKVEPAARVEPSLRAEPQPQRPSTAVEEPMLWPGERPPGEPEAPPLPPLPSTAPAPRERKPRTADPLAGLAEELSRMPGAPEPAEPAPRRMPRLQPAPPAAASATDAALKPPADQNLSEMAQRLEAALRRPGKSDDARAAPPAPKAAGEAAPEGAVFTPPAPSPRPDMALRRPLKTDDTRAAPPAPPKTLGEPAAAPSDEAQAATPADPAKGARGKGPDTKPAPQKSFYDSLEQEMASLLGKRKTDENR
jgi:flagellar protein FliO/FliZ